MRIALLSKLAVSDFTVRSNVVASFAANVIPAGLLLVSVPLYIGYVGVEAYALVGLFISMQAIFTVLDLGLSAAITRELATGELPAEQKRDLLRTGEVIYWVMAAAAAAVGLALAPFLTGYVNAASVRDEAVLESFLLIGICLGLQLPVGMYSAALLGLQRQVLLSVVNIVFAFVRIGGTLAALEFVSATPQTIFAWHAISSTLLLIMLAAAAWAAMPKTNLRAGVRFVIATRLWKFTAGVTGIAVMSVLLTQIDKIVLARLLPLETFGYYAIAGVVAVNLGRFIQPVFQVYFPRLTQLSSLDNRRPLIDAYHEGSQLVSILVLPVAAVCVFFPREILMLWQGDPVIAANSYKILALLTAGSALNAMLFIPYALQLAYGWTRFYFFALAVAVFASVPATVFLASRFGGEGAAWVWVAFNAAFVLFVVPAVHRRLLPGESSKWYLSDVIIPASAVVLAVLAGRFFLIETLDRTFLFVQLGSIFVVALTAAYLSIRLVRRPFPISPD